MHFFRVSFMAVPVSIVMASLSVVDNPAYNHFLENVEPDGLVKGIPALMETKKQLPDGMAYAVASASPLFGKLVPGNKTEPENTYYEGGTDYLDQQLLAFYIGEGKERLFTFPSDIFESISGRPDTGSGLSHAGITLGSQPKTLEATVPKKTDRRTKREIMDPDDRVEICNTWGYPYRVTGLLEFKDGGTCTGVLISPRHVMTCGHCVYDNGGWKEPSGFLLEHRHGQCAEPARISETFLVNQLWTPVGNVKHAKNQRVSHDHDWAVIKLGRDFTGEGWMSFGWDSTLSTDSGDFNLNDFASDKVGAEKLADPAFEPVYKYHMLWNSFGPIIQAEEDSFLTTIDTASADSGSPMYGYYADEDTRIVYGPMTKSDTDGTTTWNVVTRITELRFRLICELMRLGLRENYWVC